MSNNKIEKKILILKNEPKKDQNQIGIIFKTNALNHEIGITQ
jgi:hypothetical protein